jgi:antirestriction protein ArdC
MPKLNQLNSRHRHHRYKSRRSHWLCRNMASYSVSSDHVQMPPFESFRDTETYYTVLGRETTHWTRHPSRLDRDFGRKRFGDEGYAMEELVAELGSAFLCADLDLTPEVRVDHAAYVASWS